MLMEEMPEEARAKPFEVLKYGKIKERRVRSTFSKFIKIVGNIRDGTDEDLTSEFVRPYEDRRDFSL